MTEHTLLYHFYAARKLTEFETQEAASILLNCEQSNVKCIFSNTSDSSELMLFEFGDDSKVLTVRFYPKQLLYTADVFVMEPESTPDLSFIRKLETRLQEFLKANGSFKSNVKSLFASIKRGESLWRYFVTGDERIYEAKLDKLVAEVDSEFQNVKIFHSPLHGNVLYLDDDIMFGESDQEPYTRVLLGVETGKPARNDFRGKEILILGGGDGGVICELLKHNPKMVVMCDIDETVLKLCRKYMRSACEDALDSYEAENKKIIIGDCLQHLHECIQSGKKYDFIVNDLTEFPVNKEERGWVYDLTTDNSQVLELALKALKPDGCYLSRGGTEDGDFYGKAFESDCDKLGLQFTYRTSYVPSFYQDYRLYRVQFK